MPPNIPYLVYGIVSDESSVVIASTAVGVKDTNTGEFTFGTTDSDGKYVVDLANLASGYSSGDTILVYVRNHSYYGEITFTLSGVAKEQNLSCISISFATIRNKAWTILYKHLQDSTYAISENSIFSAMNDKIIADEGYPIVIIEPPKVSNVKLTLDRDGIKQREVVFNIQIYHTSAENAKILADEVESKIDTGWKDLFAVGLTHLEFPEGDYDWYTEGSKKIHMYNIPVKFKYLG